MNPVNASASGPKLSPEEGILFRVPAPVFNELWEEILAETESCWGSVVSNSMFPVMRRGDRVLVEKAPPQGISFGDIIVFRRNGQLMTHRALGRREFVGTCHFLEKGDANLESSLVPASQVIGRVSLIRNSSGTFETTRGSGRRLQLILACISYTSWQVWVALRYCLTLGGIVSRRRRYVSVYKRFFGLQSRVMVRLFFGQGC